MNAIQHKSKLFFERKTTKHRADVSHIPPINTRNLNLVLEQNKYLRETLNKKYLSLMSPAAQYFVKRQIPKTKGRIKETTYFRPPLSRVCVQVRTCS